MGSPRGHGEQVRIAIVDFGLGNLFSVAQACSHVGAVPSITHDLAALLTADAVILPGVGAFGDAMANLRSRDLVEPLRDIALSEKPLLGICLGMQLLMAESHEFGVHRGLGVVEGTVERLPADENRPQVKVPHVGWNGVFPQPRDTSSSRGHGTPSRTAPPSWEGTHLQGLTAGTAMYFVHSFHVICDPPAPELSFTPHGDYKFCSSLLQGTTFGCQFHPERSGPPGLTVYRNLVDLVDRTREELAAHG